MEYNVKCIMYIDARTWGKGSEEKAKAASPVHRFNGQTDSAIHSECLIIDGGMLGRLLALLVFNFIHIFFHTEEYFHMIEATMHLLCLNENSERI